MNIVASFNNLSIFWIAKVILEKLESKIIE